MGAVEEEEEEEDNNDDDDDDDDDPFVSFSLESMIIVMGPAFTRDTFINAWNTPAYERKKKRC